MEGGVQQAQGANVLGMVLKTLSDMGFTLKKMYGMTEYRPPAARQTQQIDLSDLVVIGSNSINLMKKIKT